MRLFQKSLTALLRHAALVLLIPVLPAGAAEFLWLSDIHFDPLADRTLVDKLAGAEPAQWAGILASGSAKFAGYGHDTNWPLFASVLEASTVTQPKRVFTLVTGDLLVHHFREQFNSAATLHDDEAFRSFARKSLAFVALQLKQRSPHVPVFVTLGNNDDECGDYAIQPDGPFLQDTAKIVGDLAGLSNVDSYLHYGSYSVPNPAVKRHRIVVLNTVFFSPKYANRCAQSAGDPGEQELAWLEKELESAKAKREKIWLVYHIPPGVDAYATTHAKVTGTVTLLWKESYVKRFLGLLSQYGEVVGPNFAGHIHADDFRLLGDSAGTAAFVMITPPVSPITGQNPTFRTVDFEAHNGKLRDQSTYYLKNLAGPAPIWEAEYDFASAWRLKGLNAQSYAALFSEIGSDKDEASRWGNWYSTSPDSSVMAAEKLAKYYCASGNLSTQGYQDCVKEKETSHGKTAN